MTKEQLQNLKKYLENSIANYLKISQDMQNLDNLNDKNYIDYFDKEDKINFTVHTIFHIMADLNSLIEKLKEQLAEINEAIFKIDCEECQEEWNMEIYCKKTL